MEGGLIGKLELDSKHLLEGAGNICHPWTHLLNGSIPLSFHNKTINTVHLNIGLKSSEGSCSHPKFHPSVHVWKKQCFTCEKNVSGWPWIQISPASASSAGTKGVGPPPPGWNAILSLEIIWPTACQLIDKEAEAKTHPFKGLSRGTPINQLDLTNERPDRKFYNSNFSWCDFSPAFSLDPIRGGLAEWLEKRRRIFELHCSEPGNRGTSAAVFLPFEPVEITYLLWTWISCPSFGL